MMRKWIVVLVAMLFSAHAFAEESSIFKTQSDKESYGIGVSTARNFKRQGIDVNVDLFIQGLKDSLSNSKLLMSEKDLRLTMRAFQQDLRRRQKTALREAAGRNAKEGAEFLAANGKKEGVVTLPDGLQYEVLKAGNGPTPTDADTVEARYRGTLLNGYEFDSTDPGGPPANLKVSGGVIPGLREALKKMPVGSKWRIYVPSALAYGFRGAGIDIGPNATLVYEVELLGIRGASK
jgi:FKBP-type peptidyl-prolyl cis-trans isomerase